MLGALCGLVGWSALPGGARAGVGDRDADARAALDAAAAEPDPRVALDRLERLRTSGLSMTTQRDVEAARHGLAIDIALAALADGPFPARYALLLRRQLGNDADPAAARARLTAERETLLARAEAAFAGVGLRTGSVGERYRALFADPRWHVPDSEAGRERAIADMNRTLAIARARLAPLCGPVPPRCLNVEARRMTAADEAAGRSGYRILPGPETRGAYVVDLARIAARPLWSLTGVVHHEMLPGHMIQLPIEAIAAPHPLRLRYAPVFPECWAIYAELLATDAGAFEGDPLGLLGHLHWMLFRVGRALADIGIHLDGWSLEAAQARLAEWQGVPAYFAPFESDLPRISRDPATRLAEALGALAIADTARRSALDQRIEFHQRLLAHGRLRTEQMPTPSAGRKAGDRETAR